MIRLLFIILSISFLFPGNVTQERARQVASSLFAERASNTLDFAIESIDLITISTHYQKR